MRVQPGVQNSKEEEGNSTLLCALLGFEIPPTIYPLNQMLKKGRGKKGKKLRKEIKGKRALWTMVFYPVTCIIFNKMLIGQYPGRKYRRGNQTGSRGRAMGILGRGKF